MFEEDDAEITVASGNVPLLAHHSDHAINSGSVAARPPSAIPARLAMLNLSCVFLFASATLTAGFALLHTAEAGNAGLVNGVILLSCVAWAYGFVLLIQWTLALPGEPDLLALLGAVLKLIASVLFCVQPLSALIEQSWGVPWTNLVGICFFHTGNFVSVWAMRKMFNYKVRSAHSARTRSHSRAHRTARVRWQEPICRCTACGSTSLPRCNWSLPTPCFWRRIAPPRSSLRSVKLEEAFFCALDRSSTLRGP